MQNRAGLSPEKLGVDFVNRGVIFPVGNKDAVEGHIRHRATRRLDHLADNFQNVAGLRLWVIGKQHVIMLIKASVPETYTTPSTSVRGTKGPAVRCCQRE